MKDHFTFSKITLKDTYSFLTDEDVNELLEIGSYRKLQNKEVIMKSGQNIRLLFFTLSGMIRGYFINPKGEEKNIFLRPKHTFTGAPECLFHRTT